MDDENFNSSATKVVGWYGDISKLIEFTKRVAQFTLFGYCSNYLDKIANIMVTNLILVVANSLSVSEFQGCLFETSKSLDL